MGILLQKEQSINTYLLINRSNIELCNFYACNDSFSLTKLIHETLMSDDYNGDDEWVNNVTLAIRCMNYYFCRHLSGANCQFGDILYQ